MTMKLKSPSSTPGGRHPEQIVAMSAIRRRDRIDHAGAPRVDAELGHLLVDAARPAFRVEIPGEAPDRIDRDEQAQRSAGQGGAPTRPPMQRRARVSNGGRKGKALSVQSRMSRRGNASMCSSSPERRSRHAFRSSGRRQSPPAQPQRQHQKGANQHRHEDVAGRGDERGNQAEPSVGRLHAAEVGCKQDDAGDDEPVGLCSPHGGSARGASARACARTAHARPDPEADPGEFAAAGDVTSSRPELGDTSIRQPAAAVYPATATPIAISTPTFRHNNQPTNSEQET